MQITLDRHSLRLNLSDILYLSAPNFSLLYTFKGTARPDGSKMFLLEKQFKKMGMPNVVVGKNVDGIQFLAAICSV
jgi:hypothetical protein